MKHRNNFHRGTSAMVRVAITLSAATAKDSIPMPNLPEPSRHFQPHSKHSSVVHRHMGSEGEHQTQSCHHSCFAQDSKQVLQECSAVFISTETGSGEDDGDLNGTRCL